MKLALKPRLKLQPSTGMQVVYSLTYRQNATTYTMKIILVLNCSYYTVPSHSKLNTLLCFVVYTPTLVTTHFTIKFYYC